MHHPIARNCKTSLAFVQAIVSWVRQKHFVAVSCWFLFSISSNLALFFSLFLSCRFSLLNCYCIRPGSERPWIGKSFLQRPVSGRTLSLGECKGRFVAYMVYFLFSIHPQEFLLLHASTNGLYLCFWWAYNKSRIAVFETMSISAKLKTMQVGTFSMLFTYFPDGVFLPLLSLSDICRVLLDCYFIKQGCSSKTLYTWWRKIWSSLTSHV